MDLEDPVRPIYGWARNVFVYSNIITANTALLKYSAKIHNNHDDNLRFTLWY